MDKRQMNHIKLAAICVCDFGDVQEIRTALSEEGVLHRCDGGHEASMWMFYVQACDAKFLRGFDNCGGRPMETHTDDPKFFGNVMSDREIQQFIMDWFLADPQLKPALPDRFEHAGTISEGLERKLGKANFPPQNRVQYGLRRLEEPGWLFYCEQHPDCPGYGVWDLSPPVIRAVAGNLVKSASDLFGVHSEQATLLKMYGLEPLGLLASHMEAV